MNSSVYIIFTIFLFYGLFSIAGAILLLAQFKNKSPEYVTAWIIGATLLGISTFLIFLKTTIPEFYSYKLGNGINAIACVYCLYACYFLLRKKVSLKRVSLYAILVGMINIIALELVGHYFSVKYQPAVVALNGVIVNLISTRLIYELYKNRKISFTLALGITFALITFIWSIRLIGVLFFEIGFAKDGGTTNLITFILLLVLSIARFMFFVAMVTSIEWEKNEDLITENYLMKIELAKKKINQTEIQYLATLNALSKARDDETGNHIIRTQHYVRLLCERLRLNGHFLDQITDEFIDLLFQATPLHDIGKIGIPDSVLLKKGSLTKEEWDVMKTHTLIGEVVLKSAELTNANQLSVIAMAKKIAGGHHEKWDGTGYPRGIKGPLIPLEARIMSIADMYDALVNIRPYKKAWTHEDAVKEIISKSGSQLDPLIVEAFVTEQAKFNAVAIEFKEELTPVKNPQID